MDLERPEVREPCPHVKFSFGFGLGPDILIAVPRCAGNRLTQRSGPSVSDDTGPESLFFDRLPEPASVTAA